MKTKDRILQLLINHRGEYLSGERLSEELNVSRCAVWKGIEGLRNEGYIITGVTRLGYMLSDNDDTVTSDGIRALLPAPACNIFDINVVKLTGSTNADAKRASILGAPEGYVMIAGEQSAGRGRLGRQFYSPGGSGLYLSILFRPRKLPADEAVLITTAAALAVCEAIEEVVGEKATIKWVNDIFVGDRKVCGILTEARFDTESGTVGAAVLGIGINVYPPQGGFPTEIDGVAGVLLNERTPNVRNRLCASILCRVLRYYQKLGTESHIDEYRRRCFIIGKKITVVRGNASKAATAYGIDDAYHLLVEYENGEREALSSGEISIRL